VVAATTVPSQVGFAFPSPGTGSFATAANTSLSTSVQRIFMGSTSSGNSGASLNSTVYSCWRGNAAGLGGFYYKQIWGMGVVAASHIIAVGLFTAASLPGPGGPAVLDRINCVFMGCETGDANFSIFHNDGAGNCTKIPLGANFAKATATALYKLELEAAPNASTISYTVTRIETGDVASGSISAELPADDVFMGPFLLNTKGSVATLASITFVSCHVWTPN